LLVTSRIAGVTGALRLRSTLFEERPGGLEGGGQGSSLKSPLPGERVRVRG